jgi:hypothetical protein
LSWLSLALALGLLARAIGEFRYVGFFKRVRGSRIRASRHVDLFALVPGARGRVARVAMHSGV